MAKKTADAQRPAKRPQRQPALPGAEQVRIPSMDQLCEDLGQALDDIAALRQNVASYRRTAKAELEAHRETRYAHASVKLMVEPGEAKVIIKRDRRHDDDE